MILYITYYDIFRPASGEAHTGASSSSGYKLAYVKSLSSIGLIFNMFMIMYVYMYACICVYIYIYIY